MGRQSETTPDQQKVMKDRGEVIRRFAGLRDWIDPVIRNPTEAGIEGIEGLATALNNLASTLRAELKTRRRN